MDYGLTRLVLESNTFIPLDKAEFEKVKWAKNLSIDVLGAEEKLNLHLDNFVEFEHDLLQHTLNNIVFRDTSWSDTIGRIHTINRRLFNFMLPAGPGQIGSRNLALWG